MMRVNMRKRDVNVLAVPAQRGGDYVSPLLESGLRLVEFLRHLLRPEKRSRYPSSSWGGGRSGCWEDTTGGDGDGGKLGGAPHRRGWPTGCARGTMRVPLVVAWRRCRRAQEPRRLSALEDSREVHGGTGADAGGVLASLGGSARDAADRELRGSVLWRSGTRPSRRSCRLPPSRHCRRPGRWSSVRFALPSDNPVVSSGSLLSKSSDFEEALRIGPGHFAH